MSYIFHISPSANVGLNLKLSFRKNVLIFPGKFPCLLKTLLLQVTKLRGEMVIPLTAVNYKMVIKGNIIVCPIVPCHWHAGVSRFHSHKLWPYHATCH